MKLLIIDGNSILNRAFFGIRILSTKSGIFTNAVYGFMNILIKLQSLENPDAIAVAFDLKQPTFRHKMYADYKAGRKPMPEELAQQLPIIKKLLDYYGATVLEKPGFEADDILGTLSEKALQSGWECVISTGDRDSLQLVNQNTRVLLATTKAGSPEIKNYDEARIMEERGVTPIQLIDIKAIEGDASDKIPGVKGIGAKGAEALIQKFGSLNGVYENIDSPDIAKGTKTKLIDSKDMAYLSKTLGEINKNVPLDATIESLKQKEADKPRLLGYLTELELFKIIERLDLKSVTPIFENQSTNTAEELPPSETVNFANQINSVSQFPDFDGKLFCDFIIEENTVCAVTVKDDTAYYYKNKITEAAEEFNKNGKPIVSFDLKSLYKLGFKRHKEDFDLSLGAYLINPSSSTYEPERLGKEYFIPDAVIAENITVPNIKSIQNAVLIKPLYEKFFKLLDQNNQIKLLTEIEMPLCEVLAQMENVGFMVDVDGIKEYAEQLAEQTENLSNDIFKEVGYEFNLNSSKQLGKALFEDLGLPASKKTKTGYSTSAEVLEGLKFQHPVVAKLLDFRLVSKLKSTYTDSMIHYADQNGRIHSTFNQTETRTGRISSLEPNLQNIPVRTEEGKRLRDYFIAPKGRVLCDADYSQIELRVLAHMANDKNMIDAFLQDRDIHTSTASQVFGMPEDAVTPLMRSRAKAVNFGIVYGIGAYSLAKDIGVPFYEAKQYIEGYMQTYSGVAEYMKNVVAVAAEKGYVTTYFDRRRYLPELSSKNGMLRAFGERVARNMPIQGTAADIIKIAMINVSKALKEKNLDAELILQVHDELIVESSVADADAVCEILKTEMENAVKLSVPLTVDVGLGNNWNSAKK